MKITLDSTSATIRASQSRQKMKRMQVPSNGWTLSAVSWLSKAGTLLKVDAPKLSSFQRKTAFRAAEPSLDLTWTKLQSTWAPTNPSNQFYWKSVPKLNFSPNLDGEAPKSTRRTLSELSRKTNRLMESTTTVFASIWDSTREIMPGSHSRSGISASTSEISQWGDGRLSVASSPTRLTWHHDHAIMSSNLERGWLTARSTDTSADPTTRDWATS